jgi:hypothetical protein
MSGPENTFIQAVHRHLPPEGEVYRMKNHNQYNGGIADCWYSAKLDLWIEWKFIVVPKRDDTVIDLHYHAPKSQPIMSALQREWLKERHREGRNIWVGIGSKDGGVILRDLDWESPLTAKQFRNLLQSRKEVAAEIAAFVQGN